MLWIQFEGQIHSPEVVVNIQVRSRGEVGRSLTNTADPVDVDSQRNMLVLGTLGQDLLPCTGVCPEGTVILQNSSEPDVRPEQVGRDA